MPNENQKNVRACIVLTSQGRQLSEQGLRIVQMTVNERYPLSPETESGEYVFVCGLAYNDKDTLARLLAEYPNTFVALSAHEGFFTLPSGPDGPETILDVLSKSEELTSWAALRELAREIYDA